MRAPVDALERRFEQTATRLGLRGRGVRTVFDDLVVRYSEGHRHYHDLSHLAFAFARLDELPDVAALDDEARGLLEWALWCHDAVQAGAGDDEARSADLAATMAMHAGLVDHQQETVRALVLATDYRHPAPSEHARLLRDADLAVLGADRARFEQYERGVRAEWAHVPLEHFCPARRAILATLNMTESLYGTAYAREHWEPRARENLALITALLDDVPAYEIFLREAPSPR